MMMPHCVEPKKDDRGRRKRVRSRVSKYPRRGVEAAAAVAAAEAKKTIF